MAAPRTGGQVLVDGLRAQGVDLVFGVPGESYLAVLDALHGTHGAIRFVSARQEGAASMMAEAYGKLTGRPGVCLVTRAPGHDERHARACTWPSRTRPRWSC